MLDNIALIARQCGSYQAIAEMMTESIRDLDSKDGFEQEWALRRLRSLADQFEETVKKYQKEVDIA